jgi:hypothetical protein
MADINQILQVADEVRKWVQVATPLVPLGKSFAQAVVKWFANYYKDFPAETQRQAIENGTDAAERIHEEINARIEDGELTIEEARTAALRPDVAKHLERALLAASETPSELLHEELAKLIGARLVAPQESRLSILLQMATDQLRYLNAEQLKLLGLTFAMLHELPDVESFDGNDHQALMNSYNGYIEHLETVLESFQDVRPPQWVDFLHFDELGLATTLKSAYGGMITNTDESQSSLLMPFHREFYGRNFEAQKPIVQWARSMMEGSREAGHFGLQGTKLSPVGYLMGQCVYDILQEQPFRPGNDWAEGEDES